MFFKNKDTKRAVREWVRLNFSGVQGSGLDTFIGKIVDFRSNQKKRLEKEGQTYGKVFANVHAGVCADIDNVVDAMKGKIACREGCSHCCKSEKICVSLEEIYMISQKVFERVSPDETENLANFVETVALLASSKNTKDIYKEGRGSACVFLKNETCSIYAHRPMACRGYLSHDEKPCKERLEEGKAGGKVIKTTAPIKPRVLEMAFWYVMKPDSQLYEINAVFRFIVSNKKRFAKLVNQELTDEDLIDYSRVLDNKIPITLISD